MSIWRDGVIAAALLCGLAASAQPQPFPGIGRAATPKEIAAWDIDVRPDFKGLPPGSGSVQKGQAVWEAQCASCHGVFGESNEFFGAIVGGTTADDIRTGHVARLNDRSFPGRTTLMKLSTVSTLWDYIRRSMPWNAPKSLSTDEVYAVTAYILHLGGVVAGDFTLSDRTIAAVQQRLPNRLGTTTEHALWPGAASVRRRPDVLAAACMTNCTSQARVVSFIPDYARNAHGNLAEQNRSVGAQHGIETGPATASTVQASAGSALAAVQTHGCAACHGLETKILGPAWREVALKYAGRADAADYLAGKIKAGGTGAWGAVAMPPQTLSDADIQAIARWIADGAKK